MIMLTTTYLLQNILDKWSTSDVRVLFNFDLSTAYAKRASNNRPQDKNSNMFKILSVPFTKSLSPSWPFSGYTEGQKEFSFSNIWFW